MPLKKMELLQVLERASMHVFSVECITTWKESGCASSMTNFEFCRDRPHSMELPTLVLMYSCLHKLRMQWSTRRSTRDPRLLSAAVQRKSDRCLRPAICMLARHTNDGSKSSQQEAGCRASPWQAPGFVCFPSPYMYALSPFRSDREGPSSKIWKGKARTLAASLSAWSVLLF